MCYYINNTSVVLPPTDSLAEKAQLCPVTFDGIIQGVMDNLKQPSGGSTKGAGADTGSYFLTVKSQL